MAQAVRSAAAGIVQFTPNAAATLLQTTQTIAPGDPGRLAVSSPLDDLSPREREVLILLAKGATNREIGTELHLSTGTVKNHVSSILRRLDLTDRTQAAVLATKHGLL